MSDLAGEQSVVVTGEHGGLHAWNKVLLNGKWLSVDPTASTTSVPYSIFEATDAKMTQEQYTPDKDWWTDSEMSKFDSTGVPSDYYTLHGLEAKSETQVISQVKKAIHNKQSEIFFECAKGFNPISIMNPISQLAKQLTGKSPTIMTYDEDGVDFFSIKFIYHKRNAYRFWGYGFQKTTMPMKIKINVFFGSKVFRLLLTFG